MEAAMPFTEEDDRWKNVPDTDYEKYVEICKDLSTPLLSKDNYQWKVDMVFLSGVHSMLMKDGCIKKRSK